MKNDHLLSVKDLRTYIRGEQKTIHAVDGVSFVVKPGETVCLVGESGSGKSVTCASLTGIIPQPPAEIVDGSIIFNGESLLDADEAALRQIRGNRIAHVFQNPQTALDPVYTVGEQVVEAMTIHRDIPAQAARRRTVELFKRVGIPRASATVDSYPHEFSSGQRQRIAIAIALAANPDLLIADEPTTAVDVTVQARLIELLRELTDGGMSLLCVTHDLRVVSALADRVLVMFGGTIVERGPTKELFTQPSHPYTQALFESYSGLSRRSNRSTRTKIPTNGCRFRAECSHAIEECAKDEQPPFYTVAGCQDHCTSCVHYGSEGDPGPIIANAHEAQPKGGTDD